MAIKFIYLDMGSTITNEEPLEELRIKETLSFHPEVSPDEFKSTMIKYGKMNLDAYHKACDYYRFEPTPWRAGLMLETLQPGVIETLEGLSKRYPLGLLANQPLGTEGRLEKLGVRKYFKVIISSAEEGVHKPDDAIFELGIKRFRCQANELLMVGDRLDNDIIPSLENGYHACWLKKGYGAYGDLSLLKKKPDYVIDDISGLLKIL
ncbi:MAG: HAD family hydrolase [Bacilli bacterium]|jgi:FMN phosphatase YigB (HAD superfamily)|nr:HAD family hydrolase [Bacilli bacterium]MCH4210370.1 HAD family hydrolase [Bacilli bacterium]MCH4228838.1 HAD family hydrolase [Bacilli bacterium]MCH4278415.1 HAD family hydrolase [Bacilli bacterium]MCI2054740.1 HAD family hydrolase [Bacilli bacterium]